MTAPTVTMSTAEQRVVLAFLRGVRRSSTFASSLLGQYEEKRSLSDRQWASARRMMAEAQAGRPVAPQPEPEPTVDLSSLPAGSYAVPGGDTRLKVAVERPEDGKWAGWIFVNDAAVYGSGRKYGHQRPGSTRYDGQIVEELRKIVADPIAAMAAYGHLTSTCGRCGRALEDAASVERGIGPVCARKMAEWGA